MNEESSDESINLTRIENETMNKNDPKYKKTYYQQKKI